MTYQRFPWQFHKFNAKKEMSLKSMIDSFQGSFQILIFSL